MGLAVALWLVSSSSGWSAAAAARPGSCGGMACCGGGFTVSSTPTAIAGQLAATAHDLDCASLLPTDPRDPFVQLGRSSDAGLLANFNCTAPGNWLRVNLAVLRPLRSAVEVRLFAAYGDPVYTDFDDSRSGYTTAILRSFHAKLSVPTYLVKPFEPLLGCPPPPPLPMNSSTHRENVPTDAARTEVDETNRISQDTTQFVDLGSCGSACCITAVEVEAGNTTVKSVAVELNQSVTGNKNLTFLPANGGTAGFSPVTEDPSTYVAQARYVGAPAPGTPEPPQELILSWKVSANESDNKISISSFSMCTDSADETRVCFADGGAGYAVQLTVFNGLNISSTSVTARYGCGVAPPRLDALATDASAAMPTGSNVAGIVVAVVLLLITTVWVKHASLANPQSALVPTRLLYGVYIGVLVALIHRSGWMPDDLSPGATMYTLNYHPVLMSLAVVVLMTEGVAAAPSSKADPTDGGYRLTHSAIQFGAMTLLAAGLATVVHDRSARRHNHEEVSHLTSAHSWIGVLVITLVGCQVIAGFWTFQFSSNFRFKQYFAAFHRFFGFLTYFSGMLACITGLEQYGHYLALQEEGQCLSGQFRSTSCYNKTFGILIFLVWGVAATVLIPKLSEAKRKASQLTDV